jgi:hypothetical protein
VSPPKCERRHACRDRESHTLFEHIATQIGIHQTTLHLTHSQAQSAIRQIGFTHPFGKLASFEDAGHASNYATW